MKINVEFDSIEEIESFARRVLGSKAEPTKKELNETAKKATEIINKAEEKEEEPAPAKKKEEKPAAGGKTETEVKVLLSEKLKAGKKAAVKELFEKYGVGKLSELIAQNGDKLDQIYAEAEAI